MSTIHTADKNCKPIGVIAKALVLSMIHTAPDEHIRKRRILIAREEGIITDKEAEDWIAILELRTA